ncbi:MAG: YihA family ribosome biogenesis GTP-binding protein [Bacteroidetes bacterium]|nr:YihA family ribosome biogenesis GTP-binding protein [Bacteroidota bacterium]
MQITKAIFVKSSPDEKGCPKPDKPEYAFIGRSNVGKSSLINSLCHKKDLAKTSAKPGKTQLINHFLINDTWYLVDLPGYGYARTSKSNLEKFEALISEYIITRKNLICLFILIDSRLEMQNIDAEFMEWCADKEIPFCIVFTKSDKLTRNQLNTNIFKYTNQLKKNWEELPPYFITSAETGAGKEDLMNYIGENLQYFVAP